MLRFARLDVKKSVLKTLAAMDLDKINMDLVESLLEWIMEGKHNYPPGKSPSHLVEVNPAHFVLLSLSIHLNWFYLLGCRCCVGVYARPG